MLIDHRCRLGTTVAVGDVEVEGGDAMFAERAFECGAAVHRFGGVISHIFIVVPLSVRGPGNRCATFEQAPRNAEDHSYREVAPDGQAKVRYEVTVRLKPRPFKAVDF